MTKSLHYASLGIRFFHACVTLFVTFCTGMAWGIVIKGVQTDLWFVIAILGMTFYSFAMMIMLFDWNSFLTTPLWRRNKKEEK